MNRRHPLISNPVTTTLLLLGAVVVAVLYSLPSFYSGVKTWALWSELGGAALFAWLIQELLIHYRLCTREMHHVFPICLTMITGATHFATIHFPGTPPLYGFYATAALLAVVCLAMQTWQNRDAALPSLGAGAIIGGISFLLPNCIYWLVLLLAALYFMRSFSGRTVLGSLTGYLLSIWIGYVIATITDGVEQASLALPWNESLIDFKTLDFSILSPLQIGFIIWIVLLVMGYAFGGFFLNFADSIHAHCSISTISALALSTPLFIFLDPEHIAIYISIAATFVGGLLSLSLGHHQNLIKQYWAILLLLITFAWWSAALWFDPKWLTA